jgi:hypothetical protein
MTHLQESRAAHLVTDFADENDDVARAFEPLRGDVLFFVDQADHRDRRRWIDDAGRALIVKRDVSADDRRAERAARFRCAFDRFAQLPEVFRLVRIAEVQIVGHGERARAGAGEIARCFGDGDSPPSRGSSAQ